MPTSPFYNDRKGQSATYRLQKSYKQISFNPWSYIQNSEISLMKLYLSTVRVESPRCKHVNHGEMIIFTYCNSGQFLILISCELFTSIFAFFYNSRYILLCYSPCAQELLQDHCYVHLCSSKFTTHHGNFDITFTEL